MESSRLLYREIIASDDEGLFELDSNPEVHQYLGNNPVTTIEQSREYIVSLQNQYRTNGIGRMAVILKDTGEFIGWAGLKLEHNVNGRAQFYDVGYRFIQKHWGKGYATEAAQFFVNYGFEVLKLNVINATALTTNIGSCKALQKAGLKFVETFDYNGEECIWFEMNNPQKIIT